MEVSTNDGCFGRCVSLQAFSNVFFLVAQAFRNEAVALFDIVDVVARKRIGVSSLWKCPRTTFELFAAFVFKRSGVSVVWSRTRSRNKGAS
jgi:hypothetical protein